MTLVVNGLDPRTYCPPKSLNTTGGKNHELRCLADIMSWRCKLKIVHHVPRKTAVSSDATVPSKIRWGDITPAATFLRFRHLLHSE